MANNCLHPGGLALTRRAISLCGQESGARFLDVGCGAGLTVALLADLGFDAFGVDIALPLENQNPRLRQGDAARLPFGDGQMDAVVMECSLSKTARPQQALAEARRVLKPGGRLSLSDMFAKGTPGTFHGVLGRLSSWEDIFQLARQAGFSLLLFEEHQQDLTSYWGQLLFELGPEATEDALGGTRDELKAAQCSYFLAVFEAADIPSSPLSPLHNWVYRRAKVPAGDAQGLARWQMERVRATVELAKTQSPFYRQHLGDTDPARLARAEDLAQLPFTTPETLAAQGARMLCVPLSLVERIRTLSTSGSTGPPKRMWFTAGDMERTVDFFSVGMRDLVQSGQTVAILMSDEKPGSIAQLLRQGLARFGAEGIIGGSVQDLQAAQTLASESACLVGLPAEMLYLCRKFPDLRPSTVLLSADYVSPAVVTTLESAWQCRVFTHYGLTETCYGLAVQCQSLQKQHLRTADYYIEIVNPDTGDVLPAGQTGEVVLTSLRSEALPLVRYRTGDVSRLVLPCGCGCGLPGLGPVLGRLQNLRQGVNIHRLDDILFPLPGLCGYSAQWENGVLRLTLESPPQPEETIARQIGGEVTIDYGSVFPFARQGKRQL